MASIAGFYYDPHHGGCLRRVAAPEGGGFLPILGVYGDDELHPPGHFWSARAFASPQAEGGIPLTVHFRGKEKPEGWDVTLEATFDVATRQIRWADGNVWLPLHAHRAQLAAPPVRSSVGGLRHPPRCAASDRARGGR